MKVYLLGAGPGDPGLLTLKAKHILETADVVVYDYLANASFLNFCRDDAEIIYVGKKGGDHTLPQDQINALLVAKAKEGKTIARLKGGDPYMFGRGAEEAEELLADGVPFEVVPGVTSAIAGPAYAGIPLTHRKYASSVSFITGHEDPTKPDTAHNWEALASGTSTLVFFMGMKNLPMIAENLMKHGMPGTTPVGLVRWGTTCRHRSHVGQLATIADDAERLDFSAPSLIVVGDVCVLRETLNWYEQRPLLGKGVVVTRAREQASGLTERLDELGACSVQFPTITIKPLADYAPVHAAIDGLADYDWLVFTSINGVKHFWLQLEAKGKDTRALGGCKVAAIGPATAEALAARGVRPDFVPAKYVAEGVVAGMLELGVKGAKVLIPRAKEAREVLPDELRKAGAAVDILPVYETVLAEERTAEVLDMLRKGEIHYITFASSSTVDNFFTLIAPEEVRKATGVKLACIGPVTAKTLEKHGFTPDIQPADFTIPALVDALAADAKPAA
ncbi:MAG: uroporphyrinogen-III C-methyltransferase [Desulfovibrionaceae bacterium]